MRIGCLQFSPVLGDIDNNLNRADAVLSRSNAQDLDLLVLPELAFSGYNFKSLQHITPYLEPTTSGITSLWARTTALKYDCVVIVGYPEKVDVTDKWPASPEYYNSAIAVNGEGETIANYRKSFLYYTDETWALEGPDGFYDGEIEGLGYCAMGICMDLNPYKFEAPWSAWEFAYHVLHKQANLVILSMAWITRDDPRAYSRHPKDPDMETLSYWLARLEPVIRAEEEGEIICVFANRTGQEEGATYAGTSCVLGINGGEVKVYGILGRGEKELLVVDTDELPKTKLVSEAHAFPAAPVESKPKPNILTGHDENESPSAPTDSKPKPNILTSDFPDGYSKRPPSRAETPAEKQAKGTAAVRRVLTDQSKTACLGSIDAVMHAIPLSPVDAKSNHAYFGDEIIRIEDMREMRSSHKSNYNKTPPPVPNVHDRPTSPKSRNASRTRLLHQEPALATHDLANEPKLITLAREQRAMLKDERPSPNYLDETRNSHPQSLSPKLTGGDQSPPRPKSTGW